MIEGRMDPPSALHPKTVWQAREAGWRDLAVKCRNCTHQAHIPWDRLSASDALDRLGERFRCTACRAKGAEVWPDMDERELKRLQRLVRS